MAQQFVLNTSNMQKEEGGQSRSAGGAQELQAASSERERELQERERERERKRERKRESSVAVLASFLPMELRFE